MQSTVIITDPEIISLLNQPSRLPCKYCKRNHFNYACDEQIKFIKKKLKKNERIVK